MAPSIVLPPADPSAVSPPSPTPSNHSVRSFLDEDPYPDGSLRRRSASMSSHSSAYHQHQQQSAAAPLGGPQLLAKLETLLNSKANEIHLAGQLGAALLQQQTELEQRIRELAEVQQNFAMSPAGQRRAMTSGAAPDSDSEQEKEIGEETRRRLADLEEDLRKWDQGNAGLYETVGMAAQRGVPSIDQLVGDSAAADGGVPQTPQHGISSSASAIPPDSAPHFRGRAPSVSNGPSVGLSQSLAASSSATSIAGAGQDPSASRRARNNAQHRNNDIELATEIGQSLLSEVRRLQALLGEKEEQMKELNGEKEALEMEVENHQVSRRTIEESVGEWPLFSQTNAATNERPSE